MEGFCVSKCGIGFDVDVSPEHVSGVLQDVPCWNVCEFWSQHFLGQNLVSLVFQISGLRW